MMNRRAELIAATIGILGGAVEIIPSPHEDQPTFQRHRRRTEPNHRRSLNQNYPALAGRNEKCPCGSQLKYKHCCAGRELRKPEEMALPVS
jgi:uncharacterized protein YecA (UPF0149 family)